MRSGPRPRRAVAGAGTATASMVDEARLPEHSPLWKGGSEPVSAAFQATRHSEVQHGRRLARCSFRLTPQVRPSPATALRFHALEHGDSRRSSPQATRRTATHETGLGPERRRGSRPGQRDCPTGAPRAPRSTQRRLVGGLCRLGLRGARGFPNPRGTARNRGHRNAVVRARTLTNLQAFHGEESARADSLKTVVSPVRVRVSIENGLLSSGSCASDPRSGAGHRY
jgi:hypothetical protein